MVSQSTGKVVLLSGFGGMLEMYDFVIFIVFAHELGLVFFPKSIGALATVYALGVFAAGYLARPIGGLIFAHFGDRYGRKKTFAVSISIMALSTFLIGVMPGFSTWGVIAPLLFILLRIIQGLAVGGEIPGAITFVYEHATTYRTFAVGILFCFVNLGILLASVVYAVMYSLLPVSLSESYAWRIAFILGSALAIIGYYFRKKLHETPEFEGYQKQIMSHKVPLIELFSKHFKVLVASVLLMALMASVVSLVFLYLTPYLQSEGGYDKLSIAHLHLFGLIVLPVAIVIWSAIAQGVKNKYRTYLILTIVFMIILLPAYNGIVHQYYQWVAYFCLMFLGGGICALSPILVAENYPVSVRYSGTAFGYNMAFAIFGGLTPLVANILSYQRISSIAPAWLLLLASVFGLGGLYISASNKMTLSQNYFANQPTLFCK